MKLSIYIAEDKIQVVIGRLARKKLEIKACKSYPINEGTFINDVIANRNHIEDILKSIREDFKPYCNHVRLVVGGSQIITRIMQVPPMSRYYLLQLAKKEIQSLGGGFDDFEYDYSVIKKCNEHNKGGTILCAAMRRSLIVEYEQLLKSCGFHVRCINTSLNALAQLMERVPHLKDQTYMVCVIDGRSMVSVLYVKGVLYYTSRMRMISEVWEKFYEDELLEAVTSIVQFNMAQKTGSEIHTIYFGGLYQEQKESFYEKIKRQIGICAMDFYDPHTNVLCDYIYGAGDLLGR